MKLINLNLEDQIGSLHNFNTAPQRIVSLVPSQTELLFDLGLEEYLIGITKFCVHPSHFLKTKTKVGGTKNPDFDKIKALKPDIIICNKEENTKAIIDECAKICTVWTTNIITITDNYQMIKDFGQIFCCNNMAQKLVDNITQGIKDFENFIANRSSANIAYFIWKKPYMVVGSDNYINAILKLNKFKNVFESNNFESNRYPTIELENLTEQNQIDKILLSSEPYPFKKQDFDEIQLFAPQAKIILVDGEMFSWHGSRLLLALDYFKNLDL